ncbi:DHA2 family efflux MFS transporter permease subunit [Companilactobacillus allii]|uniref:MFS transporter n=1 Tax=Companilactobacillus allii TaxID=1847728 RepID=A0A1P8Q0Z5_9LACO|nr:DHA2 family efflux MFS transporter permease subunit [Companilactobacillus allii]APX71469.1 MFS transporter [Companilactobacillus allii]USQ68548.1 DHA2 family efflux MFS transporter permease subunit [Companilactobacillus allii]
MNRQLNSKLIISIIATGLLSFCGVVVETATNITFPVLMKEFSVSTSTVQWMTTGYLLVASIMMPLSAFLKNSFTSKKLFSTASILFILGLLLDVTAPTFIQLVTGRIIQGIGAGIALPLMFNIILEQAPINKIGFLMGLGTLVTAVAPAIGPTFGGLVVDTFNWRSIFLFLLPIVILALILGLVSIQQVTKPKRTKLDFIGLIYIALTFVGIIVGFSNLSTIVTSPMNFFIPFVIGVISLFLFLRHSVKSDNPLLNLNVFSNKSFSLHLGAYFLIQLIALGISFILPNYIQLVNNKSALIAGLIVLPGAAIGAILAPLSGTIYDKLGARKPIMTGIILEIISLLLFFILGKTLTITTILVIYIILMLGMGSVMGNTMTNALQQLNETQIADGNGMFNTVQQFAGAVGTSIVSTIIAFSQNSNSSLTYSAKTAIGAQHAFLLLLIFILIACLSLNHATKNSK